MMAISGNQPLTVLLPSATRHPSPVTRDPFYVPPFLDVLGSLVDRFHKLWLGLGRLESRLLAEPLNAVSVRMPVYVCGLARSGSTVLHEIVASAPAVATHRVKDYPMVYTPYWWRQATARQRPTAPRERVHQDRVLITPQSPNALEEMLWMAFFPRCHDPSVNNQLGAGSSHPAFEAFYRAHLRKLLLAERATRYVAKANYHVARLAYLVRLFPDAKILLPVRAPASHIASLVRQHRWFCQGQRRHPRALTWMQRSGHFEFGRDRRPMNLGNSERVRAIQHAWALGEEIRGWAWYWDMVHGHLVRLLDDDVQVRAATKVVCFENLCARPAETIRAILHHCDLPDQERIIAQFAPSIRSPDYYQSPLSSAELAFIHEVTAATVTALRGVQ
ncbi:MAG TPA: sulfotransferase [Gemmataceae bacterium]|nr:sulfotransferase [Gemmataceae bacterium]